MSSKPSSATMFLIVTILTLGSLFQVRYESYAKSTPQDFSAAGTPTGNPDLYTFPTGVAIAQDAIGGVLSNDFDPDGDNLTAEIVTAPPVLGFDLEFDGSFTVPAQNEPGIRTFQYVVLANNEFSAPIDVTLTFEDSVTATSTSTAPSSSTPTTIPTDTPTETATETSTEFTTATETETATGTPEETITGTPVNTATNIATATVTSTSTKTVTPTKTLLPVTAASITPSRRTVKSWLHFTLTGYPHNAPVTITWRRLSGSIITIAGTFVTDGNGALVSKFRVPATPGGPGQLITLKAGSTSRTATFEVAPRIKVLYPGISATRGQLVDISLRGYAKSETVRIRWQDGDGVGWRQIGTVVTSNSGSANILLPVPSFARNGVQSVRGDGIVLRQQTNVVMIQGGPGPSAPLGGSVSAATVAQPTAGLPKELAFLALPIVSVGLLLRRQPRVK